MTRVRVTAPRSPARPARDTREAAEESEVGQVFVRSLIRSQLRLALVVAGGFLLILGAFPLLLAAVPGLAETRVAGIPFDWLLIGAGIYPVIGLSAWLFIRTATRNEARYRDLAEDQ
ncbi:hypothetical protein QFZ30_002716 [Arthrobacter pascens]|uniref:hypothetical protein n=1 Tax=Arthrobacter pascens TaxID=1677 RepID=UPI00278E7211|nr:hypothetical protein [Arthrobacter pascens]MDQ0679334.1 hypothetical protein [Arthrobacter pascens]